MKKWLLRAFVVLGVLIIIGAVTSRNDVPKKSSVSSSQKSTTPVASGAITGACFVASEKNPIFSNNSHFDGAHWNDPSVLFENGTYIMYASAAKNDSIVKIYRLTSPDGASWTLSPQSPVLEPGASGSWDSKSVETPSVVKFNGTYYLFYTGYDTSHTDVTNYKIGYATSNDGITWTRSPSPLLSPTDPKGQPNLAFNQYVVGEPGAVVVNGALHVYFTAVGANQSVGTTLQTIGLVTSTDGTTWSKPEQVLVPDQTLYPRAKKWVGYSTPSATVIGGKVHLFFDVASEDGSWHQEALHHAVSSNGRTGWVQDKAPLFTRSDFSWTRDEIRSPTAIAGKDGVYLWFAGHSKFNLGIGLARCNTQ